jgi:hypothetical protein
MSRWISTHTELLPLYGTLSGYTAGPFAQVIFEFDGGIPVAAALFDNYNDYSIHAHVWIASGHKPSRVWWWAIHHYPLCVLKVNKVYAVIRSTNKRVLRLVESMGFKYVTMVPDYFREGEHCMFFEGTVETAKFWFRYRNGAAPPKYPRNAITA